MQNNLKMFRVNVRANKTMITNLDFIQFALELKYNKKVSKSDVVEYVLSCVSSDIQYNLDKHIFPTKS